MGPPDPNPLMACSLLSISPSGFHSVLSTPHHKKFWPLVPGRTRPLDSGMPCGWDPRNSGCPIRCRTPDSGWRLPNENVQPPFRRGLWGSGQATRAKLSPSEPHPLPGVGSPSPGTGPGEWSLAPSEGRGAPDRLPAKVGSLRSITRGRPGVCLLYTSPSPRDATLSRMPSSA